MANGSPPSQNPQEEGDHFGLESIDTSISWFERLVFSGRFSAICSVLGLILTIVLGLFQNWLLVTAAVVSFGSVIGASLSGRAYARQLRHRFTERERAIQSAAERAAMQHTAALDALHYLLRHARDSELCFSTRYESLLERVATEQSYDTISTEVTHLRDEFFRNLLEQILRVFSPIVRPDARLWSAIRIIRKSNGTNSYVTLLRVGAVDEDRSINSKPVREDCGLPRYLKEQHSLGNGIVIIDGSRTEDQWETNPNDQREDDRSVMAGPIFLRAEGRDQLVMILYINSTIEEGVFHESHKPYMRCCIDVFSTAISIMTDLVPEPVTVKLKEAKS